MKLAVNRRDKIRNVDIRERLGETFVQKVYQRQHTWLGHVLRMSNENIAIFALEGKVEGKRRVGKAENIIAENTNICQLNLGEAIETANYSLDCYRL